VPTLGGRSVRPILDRMDYALTQLLEGYDVTGVVSQSSHSCSRLCERAAPAALTG
jgi:hypothetical protein